MASKPGLLTEWPWQKLGNFKYVIMLPWVVPGIQMIIEAARKGKQGWEEVDMGYLSIFPSLLLRLIHHQIWISLARFQTVRSPHRIVDRSIEFEQVDREHNWDDQILLNGIFLYIGHTLISSAKNIPLWRANGVIITALMHMGPVEFLYYWFHRALHHHFLYSRYHSHHHASIVTEPITSVIHPFAEHIVYYLLFAIPVLTTIFTGTASIIAILLYTVYIDFMNNMGHCNFELVPKWLFHVFPPLKYLMYTPSFHSLHHTQFRTNYSLFMPFYDYIYHTMDKSSDELYESSLKGKEETPADVVHLTHPTTLQSIYHLRLGFASFASKPYNSKWYILIMWPMAGLLMVLTWFSRSSFTVERNKLKNLKMQTWAIPRYSFQYGLSWERGTINDLIEKTILEADENGVKVLSLGLLNQAKELNDNGKLYLQNYPKLKLRIVDGSSLAAAVILNSIPKGTTQVLLKGRLSKVACATAQALCKRGVQVLMTDKHELNLLELRVLESTRNLSLSSNFTPTVWLMGDGLDDTEQKQAPKGTHFIPCSQFPPKKVRKDCIYYKTAAMKIPEALENMHSCENWLPRRVMSAWRVAGIVHALEGWGANECGDIIEDIDKVWSAALHHGFLPLPQV